jgi:lipid A 3-O-deacylase
MACRQMIAGLFAIMIGQLAYAQRSVPGFDHEVQVVTDNDNYLLQKRDGYYTNGLNVSLQRLGRSRKAGTSKVIMRYELGQAIFNPYKYNIINPELMDRPFAGYLFVKLSRSVFFKKGVQLQYGLSAGMLGKRSGAAATQRGFHKLINIYEVKGWDHQLKDEPAINMHFQYAHGLAGLRQEKPLVDVHATAKATLGTAFTDATVGAVVRIGWMERMEQSVYWNSRLHGGGADYRNRAEMFLFFHPELMVQGYNVTFQGGMFRSDKGPVTGTPNRFIYQHRLGLMYARHRFSVSLGVIHRTREAREMRRKENYGSVGVGYRFN